MSDYAILSTCGHIGVKTKFRTFSFNSQPFVISFAESNQMKPVVCLPCLCTPQTITVLLSSTVINFNCCHVHHERKLPPLVMKVLGPMFGHERNHIEDLFVVPSDEELPRAIASFKQLLIIDRF